MYHSSSNVFTCIILYCMSVLSLHIESTNSMVLHSLYSSLYLLMYLMIPEHEVYLCSRIWIPLASFKCLATSSEERLRRLASTFSPSPPFRCGHLLSSCTAFSLSFLSDVARCSWFAIPPHTPDTWMTSFSGNGNLVASFTESQTLLVISATEATSSSESSSSPSKGEL